MVAVAGCTSALAPVPNHTSVPPIPDGFATRWNNELDLLFIIDDSSNMAVMQQKLAAQLPAFIDTLNGGVAGPLDLHVGVVSSDLGAPGDATSELGCTAHGDAGGFQAAPRGTCSDTTLAPGNAFISTVGSISNYSDPSLADVLQCIIPLGENGCGFEHQLAAIDRALGADGLGSPPDRNVLFLRPEAYLAIVMLTNEDDCSAPDDTQLYSLDGGPQSVANPLGPLTHYRCNEYGHLCQDPTADSPDWDPNPSVWTMPPLGIPDDATGDPRRLSFVNCQSDEMDLLTPVAKFVGDIKALKADPDQQIFVAAITAPAAPYAVEWVPAPPGSDAAPGELWPEVMHSCGAPGADDVNPAATALVSDGSYGDPAVRIAQFVSAFPNQLLASVCDADYGASMAAIAGRLSSLLSPACIGGKIKTGADGNPSCTVLQSGTKTPIPPCATNGGAIPCWTLQGGVAGCSGQQVVVDQGGTPLQAGVSCDVCLPGSADPGC